MSPVAFHLGQEWGGGGDAPEEEAGIADGVERHRLFHPQSLSLVTFFSFPHKCARRHIRKHAAQEGDEVLTGGGKGCKDNFNFKSMRAIIWGNENEYLEIKWRLKTLCSNIIFHSYTKQMTLAISQK